LRILYKIIFFAIFFVSTNKLIAQYEIYTPSKKITKDFRIDIGGEKSIRSNFFEFIHQNDHFYFKFDNINIASFFSKKTQKDLYKFLGRPDEFNDGSYIYHINESISNCKQHIVYGCPSPRKIPPIGGEETPHTVKSVTVYYDFQCELDSEIGYLSVVKIEISFYKG
jgi:hypothetical protein